MKIEQSKDELNQHLVDQIKFLQNSSKSYDNGFEGEARRLATVMRVLLHDTKNSQALLTSLGIKEKLQYYDKCGAEEDRTNCIVFSCTRMTFGEKGLIYSPSLEEPKGRTTYDLWWNGLVLIQHVYKVKFTRKDIICSVADMDGGAHVDQRLNEDYARLTRHNSMGWIVTKAGKPGIVENGPELPIVRQCAYELYLTIVRQIPDLLGIQESEWGE